jgi:FkbM family methyltransferase
MLKDLVLARANISFHTRRLRDSFAGLLETFRVTENWWSVFCVYSGIKSNTTVKLRDTSILTPLTKENWDDYRFLRKILLSRNMRYLGGGKFAFSNPNGLEFDYRDTTRDFYLHATKMKCYRSGNDVLCEVDGLKFLVPFPNGTIELEEVFVDKIYGEPRCQDAVVVDVGAFIGDSSLFYASRGAKKIIAFEPIPLLYEILRKNVALNGFENLIQSRNEAIGESSGLTRIHYKQTQPGSSSLNSVGDALTFEVSSVSLSEIIMDLEWVDILKMDCEGCEHKTLPHAAKTGALKHVGMVILEVHSGVRNIVKLLRNNGFTVNALRRITNELWVLSARQKATSSE